MFVQSSYLGIAESRRVDIRRHLKSAMRKLRTQQNESCGLRHIRIFMPLTKYG